MNISRVFWVTYVEAKKSKGILDAMPETEKGMAMCVCEEECCKEVAKEVGSHVEVAKVGGKELGGVDVGDGIAGVGTGKPAASKFWKKKVEKSKIESQTDQNLT